MKQRFVHLLATAGLFILVFVFGKLAFLGYNHDIAPTSLTDVWQVVTHGLSMDLSTTGYLITLPWLLMAVSLFWKRMPLRPLLITYYIIVSILLAGILVGDTVMYSFWKTKLDSTAFSYLGEAQGATNSVSLGFIIVRLLAFVFVSYVIGFLLVRLTPRKFVPVFGDERGLTAGRALKKGLLWLLIAPFTFLFIRGGWGLAPMNVGVAYYSSSIFHNHAAINPAFSLMYSLLKDGKHGDQFQYGDAAEAEALTLSLYDQRGDDIQDTLLTTQRPNVLWVMLESYGGQFIKELGGAEDVSPNFTRLIPEGVFWDNLWSNSFRTDRGFVSGFSGWLSYPTVSLMRLPGYSDKLPSIAHALASQGYSTHFLYGGDIMFRGKNGYLITTGYQRILSDKDFSREEAGESKWGVNDRLTVRRTLREVEQLNKSGKPWHYVLQTLSSHEPYEVPYDRLPEKIPNAFAFTDDCIGELVDGLKQMPGWDNLLILIMTDHGSTYGVSYQDPAFFRGPLLWLGGAVKEPRRMSVLMNQSDVVATLLAQMGISTKDFPWSRNVLSEKYTYPFIYSSYGEGIMFRDSTGTTIYDVKGNRPIYEQPSASADRLTKAKAILQTSYRQVDELK